MAAPVFWKQPTFLYAFGNTPAFSLAQNLAPEDPADFLLLGCGDARNVLYTLYAAGADLPNGARVFDFTCVDTEPAVLARNAVLFALLVGDPTLKHIDRVWSIYYDMKLDQPTLDMLYVQCEALVAAADTLDTWSASAFAGYIPVLTTHTLAELRRMWTKFLSTRDDPRLYKERLRVGAAKKLAEIRHTGAGLLSALRSAGPLWMKLASCGADLHETYWKTGLTASNAAATYANPTLAFALSDEPFPLHAGSIPCLGFHLAEVVATHDRPASVADVYAVAKAQFRAWCRAFAAARVVVRFCVGDAFTVCRALALPSSSDTGLSVTQWSAIPLELVDASPRTFSSIDTSNLVDALGLLNVLVRCAPLLAQSRSAVLYTETLRASAGAASKSFRNSLCADLSALALFVGLVPAAHIAGYTTQSNVHQIMLARAQMGDTSSHERVVWQRTPATGSPLHFADPAGLAELLHKLYYEMFQPEDLIAARQDMESGANTATSLARSLGNITYVRASFVALLMSFRARLAPETDWVRVADGLVDRVGSDNRLMIGMNSYQDLCAQLHASGLSSVVPSYSDVPYRIDKRAGPFAGWDDAEIRRLVHVALRVPASAFARAEGFSPATPVLFTTRNASGLNYFATFATVRGSVARAPRAFSVRTSLEPTADVVAIARIPAWLLMAAPASTTVSLTLRPGLGVQVMQKLGPNMEVYAAAVLDTDRVFFSAEAPLIGGVPLRPLFSSDVPALAGNGTVVHVALDARNESVATLTIRQDVTGTDARARWAEKADVRTVQLTSTVAAVETVCGIFRQVLSFPLPVDATNAKLRIARKSFYVEVIASTARFVNPARSSMHHVNLDRLPRFDPSRKPEWLDMHCQFAFSDRERANRDRFLNSADTSGRIPLVELKDDIFMLLMRCAGFHNPVRVFCLVDASKPGDAQANTHTVIFVSSLRLDAAANTILADAYVLAADASTLDGFPTLVAGQLPHPSATAALWREMLVGFVERCRTWAHKPACARPTDALCGCGAGADVDGFRAVKEWRGVSSERVTRAAISLPFAPCFLDSVGGHMPDFATLSSHAPAASESVGQCARCGNDARLRCTKCKQVQYCDKNCQRAHWKVHKSACQ